MEFSPKTRKDIQKLKPNLPTPVHVFMCINNYLCVGKSSHQDFTLRTSFSSKQIEYPPSYNRIAIIKSLTPNILN